MRSARGTREWWWWGYLSNLEFEEEEEENLEENKFKGEDNEVSLGLERLIVYEGIDNEQEPEMNHKANSNPRSEDPILPEVPVEKENTMPVYYPHLFYQRNWCW